MSLDAATEAASEPRTLAPDRQEVTSYDFRRPTKLSREGVRLLQVTFETFARRLTTLLTSSLRQVCSVSFNDVSQQTYEDYVTERPTPTVMAPISLPRLNTTAVMQFSLPVALTTVDHMLGGPGGTQPDRSLTDIETSLITGLLEQIIEVLAYAMEPVAPLSPKLGMLEYNPQFVQVVGATDTTLVAMFDMTIANETSEMTLCLPLAPLLPILKARRDRSAQKTDTFDAGSPEARHVATHLSDTRIDVTVEFTPSEMTPTDVMALTAGDVIPLPHRVGSPLAVKVGTVTYAHALAGRAGSRLAARITDTLQEQA